MHGKDRLPMERHEENIWIGSSRLGHTFVAAPDKYDSFKE